MDKVDARRRLELLEETLAELLVWVRQQEIYDDQFDEETAWLPRLEPLVRPDGLAPLAPSYEDQCIRLADLPSELHSVSQMVQRAEGLLAGGRLDAALDRARSRRRLTQRRSAQSSDG
ncbi:hypothetical protein [Blastococcus sp. TF02A-35]|uniref:hypothetical protein n=1 Tax=Blastococcus sp. TF02A-35 TaxID=2559612 RepID=UPI0010742889|nr:hypothetical protein [Blastococcus sp. TF02A_35]TFV53409.1 hypothetical protein E4P43_02410 [Blastococcus sp. TF02A_35]